MIKINQLTYQKYIQDFISKFNQYNAHAGYTGALLRNKIKGKIPTAITHCTVAMGPVDTNELWLAQVKKVGIDEECFRKECKEGAKVVV